MLQGKTIFKGGKWRIYKYQLLNQAATTALEKNRLILRRILEAIVFLGRLGLPLRVHRDSGLLSLATNEERFDYYAEENFRALLRLMSACGDSILQSKPVVAMPHMFHAVRTMNSYLQSVSFLLKLL